MIENEPDRAMLEKAKSVLSNSIDELPGAVAQQLQKSRTHALAQITDNRPWWRAWYVPAATTATVCALALVFISSTRTEEAIDFSDLEMLSNSDIELYEELEFYEWLPSLGQTG